MLYIAVELLPKKESVVNCFEDSYFNLLFCEYTIGTTGRKSFEV